ncbi:hypothetical protein LDENG_00162370 [Lucifuga dentata]|nr:hypothetical protein LDENG_00162370 [Lucifuga dentata]
MANIFDFTLDELQNLKSSSSRTVSIDQDSTDVSTSGSATTSSSSSYHFRRRVGSRKRKLPSNSYSQWASHSDAGEELGAEEPSEILEDREATSHAPLTAESSHFLYNSSHLPSDTSHLHSSISSYFGVAGSPAGTVQYLLEWEGPTPY